MAHARPVTHRLDHLGQLLRDFEIYYNDYRGMPAGGAVPAVIHRGGQWTKPAKSAKAVPGQTLSAASSPTLRLLPTGSPPDSAADGDRFHRVRQRVSSRLRDPISRPASQFPPFLSHHRRYPNSIATIPGA